MSHPTLPVTGVVADPVFFWLLFFTMAFSEQAKLDLSVSLLLYKFTKRPPLEFELFHKNFGWSRGFLSGEKSLPYPSVKSCIFIPRKKQTENGSIDHTWSYSDGSRGSSYPIL